MARVPAAVSDLLRSDRWIRAVLSDPPGRTAVIRVAARPVMVGSRPKVQIELHEKTRVRHENLDREAAAARLESLLETGFRQLHVATPDENVHLLMPSGRMRRTPATRPEAEPSHDRRKRRLLDGAPFLTRLGIAAPNGAIKASRQAKFRQMIRFAELVEDVLEHLPPDRPLRVADFGCGRAYLTFALAHLLHERDIEARIVGVDLKEDAILQSRDLARDLGWTGMEFRAGDIATDPALGEAHLAVLLHACDTATDEGIARAVTGGASVILAVPCCQRELRDRLTPAALEPMMRHGIVRERVAALATDSMRAALLEAAGYRTQILEFVDTEHTPKNLMIRAMRSGRPSDAARKAYLALRDFWGAGPRLERLLDR